MKALLLVLAGCLGPEARSRVLDRDGDGLLWPDDCDDADPSIGTDPVWYADADEDGHGAPSAVHQGCEPPPGAIRTSGDCDDLEPAVHPDAGEVQCDGFADTDCDPETPDGVASVAGRGYPTLEDAVAAAAPGDTVAICPGDFDVSLEIDGITLEGAGVGTTTLRSSTGSAVRIVGDGGTLRELTLREASGRVPDVTTEVVGFTIDRGGGCVDASDANGPVLVEDASIEYCTALGVQTGLGGGIAGPTRSTLTLRRVTVANNVADLGGGVFTAGDLVLEQTLITANTSGLGAGGVLIAPSGTAVADDFTEIGPDNIGAFGGGIGVYGEWTGGWIHDNRTLVGVDGGGGGVALSGGTLRGARVTGNVADSFYPYDRGGIGGGVLVQNLDSTSTDVTAALEDVEVTDNSSTLAGGGVAVLYGDLQLIGGEVSANVSSSAGGLYSVLSHLVLDGTVVDGNRGTAAVYGGGLGGGILHAIVTDAYDVPIPCPHDVVGCGLEIFGGSVSSNEAPIGAGVLATEALEVDGTVFADNNALSGGSGGAILSLATIDVRNAEFARNHADLDGGAIFLPTIGASTIASSTFTDNTAGQFGGAVLLQYSLLDLTDSDFTGNVATDAAVTLIDGSPAATLLLVSGGTFTGNVPADLHSEVPWARSSLASNFTCQNPSGPLSGCE